MTAAITEGRRQWSCSIGFALFALRIKDTVGMPYCVSKNKQDQDLLQTSNGVGVIVLRQILSLMHDKNFTKASQAAAFLGLIPIQSLNPFSKWYIRSMIYQYMFDALYRHQTAIVRYELNDYKIDSMGHYNRAV
ncbi:transposase [Psychrobacter sp. W2-37-MNA-CIBAN-0211]|uniref:transposase n=1 Tax=Psychrobacter sp. W2-37-MNA-CIBAN-0211 TaxID=3140443 RepID=UPI00332E81D8